MAKKEKKEKTSEKEVQDSLKDPKEKEKKKDVKKESHSSLKASNSAEASHDKSKDIRSGEENIPKLRKEAPKEKAKDKEPQKESKESTEEIEEKPKVHKPQKPHIKKRGKKYKEAAKLIEKDKLYTPEEAIDLALKTSITKFDSSLEVHFRLNIKPEQTEQNIRTVADLPEGTGKKIKVAAIISSQKEKETKDAGADVVGSDDLISKIEKGFSDFDIVIATPDMMGKIGRLGKILGTKGLMPNPKTETVTDNPGRVVKMLKKGRVELKNDKFGIVHTSFGKISLGKEKLLGNFKALAETLFKAKPSQVKGQFLKSAAISTTMGPSVKIDINKI